MSGQLRAIVVMMVCGVAATAAAQPQPSPAEQKADQLFKEGRALLDAGDAAAACPKFEESQRLDPGLGTLLNLADCYERTGRLASSLTTFRSAEEQARRLGEKKRETAAADRARSLESRVSRLSLTVAAGDRPAGFQVRLDGAALSALDLGRPLPIDPGAHVIEAVAPGFTSFSKALEIAAAQSNQQVDIPLLVPADGHKPPDDKIVVPPVTSPATVDPGAGRRRIGIIVGAAGVAGLGAGVVVGLLAKGKYGDAGCDGGVCPGPDELDKANKARRLGNIGTVIGGVGLVAVGAGVVLWLTAPKAHSVEVAPTASADGAGVTVFGRF